MKSPYLRQAGLLVCACLFWGQGLFAQGSYLKTARKELRKKNYYWSAYYSACSLGEDNLSPNQVKSAQKILRESWEPGIQVVEKFIAQDSVTYHEFVGDETVPGRKKTVGDLENLQKLNDKLMAIPPELLKSTKKREPDLAFDPVDYSSRIQRARKSYLASITAAAQQHYDQAARLDSSETISDWVKAYEEYSICMGFEPEFKDAVDRQRRTGNRIGERDYQKGSQARKEGSLAGLESALQYFDHGLKYARLEKLREGRKETVAELSEIYYSKAKVFLQGETRVVNYTQTRTQQARQPENMGLRIGFDKESLVGTVVDVIAGRSDNGTPDQSDRPEVTTQTVTTTEIRVVSIDNSYGAMTWLRKLLKINPQYKDGRDLMAQAEAGTRILDHRNNQSYSTFRVGNRIWMGEDLNWEVGESAYYYWTDEKGKRYTDIKSGRYYSGSAVAKYKNSLCPAGWRLPTTKDVEALVAQKGQKDKVYGNLQFGKLGYGVPYSETNYSERSFSQKSHGVVGEWWLAEPTKTLMNADQLKPSTSTLEVYHHCRCIKDYRPKID